MNCHHYASHPFRARASRAAFARKSCSCSAQAGWGSIIGGSRAKSYPSLSYSVNRQDITGADLGMLLAAAASEDMATAAGPPLCRQNFSYWSSPQGLHHAAKLEVALRRSVATVACFTTLDVYGEAAAAAAGGAGACSSSSSGGGGGTDSAAPTALHPAQDLATAEEECPLTAQQHRNAGSLSPSRGAGPPAARAGSSGGAGAPGLRSPCGSSSFSSSSFTSSSSSASTPQTSSIKPPTPKGVPDMDWNWLQPSSVVSSRLRAGDDRCSGSGSSGRASRSDRSGSGGRAAAVPSSSTASAPSFSSSSGSSFPFSSSFSSSSAGKAGRKSLVGFARATGDNSLVATIYDVAVHPALRGLGIGRRLVKLLVQQVQARAVYDIGVVTPAGAAGFWERCAFEDDREGSTFMLFVGSSGRGGEGEAEGERDRWAPCSTLDLLERSSLEHWEAASHSESLQGILAHKLELMRGSDPAGQSGNRPAGRSAGQRQRTMLTRDGGAAGGLKGVLQGEISVGSRREGASQRGLLGSGRTQQRVEGAGGGAGWSGPRGEHTYDI